MAKIADTPAVKSFHGMNAETRNPANLKPHPQNSRKHSASKIEEIENSMQEFGWTMPTLIDEKDLIIAGYGRTLAACSLGMSSVPVIIAERLSSALFLYQ